MIDTTTHETRDVLDIAREYAQKEAIGHVVIASTRGETAKLALEIFGAEEGDRDEELIVVTHAAGFREPNEAEFAAEVRGELEEKGVTVFTGPMIFHSWNDHYRKSKGTILPTTMIADTLRMFGQGTKVCAEIVLMATDAGLVPSGTPVIAIAGTGYGADTVLLIQSTNSRRMMDLAILDVIAKPRSL